MNSKVAINGLGRIAALKLALAEPALQLVAVNDIDACSFGVADEASHTARV